MSDRSSGFFVVVGAGLPAKWSGSDDQWYAVIHFRYYRTGGVYFSHIISASAGFSSCAQLGAIEKFPSVAAGTEIFFFPFLFDTTSLLMSVQSCVTSGTISGCSEGELKIEGSFLIMVRSKR